ncbi:uncharacterized protein METZ01_LOCUS128557 [marine metagenome]|uniref:Uncharacterized protein n=1 Tax=marine metagenome TaxID=408172 RepID=A0A381YGQ1_9ZZZZ
MTMSINRAASTGESRPADFVLTVIFITPKINLANLMGTLIAYVIRRFSTGNCREFSNRNVV